MLVYDSAEFKELDRLAGNDRFSAMLGTTDSATKSKAYSLLPFLFEAAFTSKSFVLRMQLYPKAGMLQFDTLQFGGVETTYMPVD